MFLAYITSELLYFYNRIYIYIYLHKSITPGDNQVCVTNTNLIQYIYIYIFLNCILNYVMLFIYGGGPRK